MKFKKGDLVQVKCDLSIDTYKNDVMWNKEKDFYNGYVFQIVKVYEKENCYWLCLSEQVTYPPHILKMQDDFHGSIFGWTFLEEWLVRVPNPELVKFLRSLKDEV